ncbi:MAG: hypothetical protein AAB576_01400, partial [Elusimicrobiota bacterium]
ADAGRMGRTLVLEKKDKRKSPYGPAYEDRDVAPPEEKKIKLNRAYARLMGASAQISQGKDQDFRSASSDEPETPSDLHGTDWQALIDEELNDNELLDAFTKAIEGAQWKTLHKAKPGEIRPSMGLGLDRLRTSQALKQLVMTKTVTGKAVNDTTARPESRINQGRATYFGERF